MYEKIKQLCDEKNISIYHLEKTLNLSTGSVCKWNKSIPRADNLQKVAEYLGVSAASLLNAKEE